MKKLVALLLVVVALAAMTGSAAAKARGYGIIFGGDPVAEHAKGHGVNK